MESRARPAGTGSCPSDQAPAGLDAARVDPSCNALGRVMADAMLFMDMAAGEERSYRHDAGFELHAIDICAGFAKALGVEPCSDEYYDAIKRLREGELRIVPADPTEEMTEALDNAYWRRHEHVACYAPDDLEEGGGPAGYAYRAALAKASASATEAQRAETGTGSVHEGAAPPGETPHPISTRIVA